MKAIKKRNHLEEEAEKIEEIPEEQKDGADDGQDKPAKAKETRKNRFLARLRKSWARFAGCFRSCICIRKQGSFEELPELSGISMVDSKAIISFEEEKKEDDVKENEYINSDNKEEELEILQEFHDLIQNLEDLYIQYQIENQEQQSAKVELVESQVDDDAEVSIKHDEESESFFFTASLSFEEKEKEDDAKENLSIKDDDKEAELEILDEYHDLIQNLEDLFIQYKIENREQQSAKVELVESQVDDDAEVSIKHDEESESFFSTASLSFEEKEKEDDVKENLSIKDNDKEAKLEILDEYHDLIQNLEDLHIQYRMEHEQQIAEMMESKVGEDEEVNIKEDGKNEWENAENAKDSQKGSCEIPGPSHISSGAISSKEDNKEESNMINANEERESCRPEKESNSNGSSLELETLVGLYKTANTIDSDSSDSKSCYCSLKLETPEELHTSIKPLQSDSSHDEKPTTSNTCLEETNQTDKESSGTVPLSLESFTFHQKLGSGTFGEVFLARDHIRKEYVAIKASQKFDTAWSRCNNIERGILKRSYRSPYLIHGLAAFHTLNYAYFVMELAPGGNLHHFLVDNFPIDSTTIKFITAEVICGTQFLHRKNIIHRDLKPGNILLTADGHVKITDFGLAAVRVSIRTKLRCRGTPGYAAPEMVTLHEHGSEVDYFAIGVILYILCTGMKPFPGYCKKDIEYSVLCCKPHYPRSLNRVTQNILKGLLCKNPFKRLGRRDDVKDHPFFNGTNWEDVEARRVVPPAIMITESVDLNSNETLDYAEKPNREVTVDQKVYDRFSFVCQEWSRHYHPVISETTA